MDNYIDERTKEQFTEDTTIREAINNIKEDFVRLGIRYIAIMDNIDTKDGLSDFLPVQDWFNEMHAKNTSKKVRAVFQNKGMSGKPLTTVIPYGYKKNEAESAH